MKGFVKTSWPYDDEAAKTIECYARRMKVSADVPSGKAWRMVYVWRDTRDADQNYSYTVQGEFTGATETANLSDAIDAATAGATR